jgi:hypothetical protein
MMPAVLVGVLVAVAAWFVARPLFAGAGGARVPLPGRPTVVLVVAAAAAVCIGVVLTRAVAPGRTGAQVGARPAAAVAAPSTPTPASNQRPSGTPTSASAPSTQLTDDQLAAVSSALASVRAHPRDAAAHLDLARAYAGADQPQLSTVEYLAVVQLDKANPEANSALALVALGAGRPTEGKRLVDAVLAKHPRYPDALYTRGLIYLMGLHTSAPGVRDLKAYLRAAPYGSHRAAVETLLAMVSDGRTP